MSQTLGSRSESLAFQVQSGLSHGDGQMLRGLCGRGAQWGISAMLVCCFVNLTQASGVWEEAALVGESTP